MNYRNLFRIAFRAIANNKMRAFLTMLGVIIGVAAVIAMLAIGQGSKRSIRASIEEMGSNMIMIHPGGERMGGVRLSSSDMQSLKLEDYQAIVNQNTYLDKITPTVNSSGQLIYGGNNTPSTVYGVNEQYLDIRRYAIGSGEMFTESDIKRAAKVCVVGQTVVDNLFTKGEDPLGKTIRFNSIPFRIIGVLEPKGYNSMGQDQDDLILAPYTTVQKRILAITYIQGITASAIDESQTQQAIDEISDILRTNHKLRATDEDDFTVRSTQEMSDLDDGHDDNSSGLHCKHIAGGGRYRHHEHHVRFGHRTHPRDRTPHVDRRQGASHTVAVPDRGGYHKRYGRYHRGAVRDRGLDGDQPDPQMADICTAGLRTVVVRRMYADGYILRMVSGQEGFAAQPDRCSAFRVRGAAVGR